MIDRDADPTGAGTSSAALDVMRSKLIAWIAAFAVWSWTLASQAQSLGSGGVPAFDETMDRGLVPLFLFVAGGIGVMTLAAFVAVVFLRWSQSHPLRGA